MIKKLTLISLISTLSCTTMSYAGEMGDASIYSGPFVSLEGGYSWASIDGLEFDLTGFNGTITTSKKHDPIGVRIAAGMMSMLDEQYGFTGEIGWGYYGTTTITPELNGIIVPLGVSPFSTKYSIYGFDALVGLAYVQPCWLAYMKAGAMIQNMHVTSSASNQNPVFNSFTSTTNSTEALPEIKVGVGYSFNPNWAITGSALIAIGNTNKTVAAVNLNEFDSSLSINGANPSVAAILFGIQYTA